MKHAALSFALLLSPVAGCDDAEQRCGSDQDCPQDQICELASGSCIYECTSDSDCQSGLTCESHRCSFQCAAGEPRICPEGMISICSAFCIDVYEASRPDATSTEPGSDESRATSRPGVIPWFTGIVEHMNQAVAGAACAAAGKRLCSRQEWRAACSGLAQLAYSYGNAYDPSICNGIDTYCHCDPYPHCYEHCGADFHVMPTGSFPSCQSELGVWDINGNVWELIASSDGIDHYRGGAYNCKDSEENQACDYDATWNPVAKGFRCCAGGSPP